MSFFVPRTPNGWRLFCVLAMIAACGCSSLDLRKALRLSGDEPKVPARIVDVWSDGVLSEPGMPSVRGFGGRIMFYGSEDKKPVIVDGTFTVCAFDEADRDTGYAVPEKKYVFLPEHLPKHYSKSELGHSYSFWLPWDEVGGPERRITLIARFEPKKGTPVLSKPCTKTLPGAGTAQGGRPRDSVRVGTRTSPYPVRPVSHEEPAAAQTPREQMSTFTLDVPSSLARPDASPPTGQTASPGGARQNGPTVRRRPLPPRPRAPALIARRPHRGTTLTRGWRLHRQDVSHLGDSRLKEQQLLAHGPIPFGGNLTPQRGNPRFHRHLDPIGRVKSRDRLQAASHLRVDLRPTLCRNLESHRQPWLVRPLGPRGRAGNGDVHLIGGRSRLREREQVFRGGRDHLLPARLCPDKLRRIVRVSRRRSPRDAGSPARTAPCR